MTDLPDLATFEIWGGPIYTDLAGAELIWRPNWVDPKIVVLNQKRSHGGEIFSEIADFLSLYTLAKFELLVLNFSKTTSDVSRWDLQRFSEIFSEIASFQGDGFQCRKHGQYRRCIVWYTILHVAYRCGFWTRTIFVFQNVPFFGSDFAKISEFVKYLQN